MNIVRQQRHWGSRAIFVPGGKGHNSYVEIRPWSKKQEDDGKKKQDKVELINKKKQEEVEFINKKKQDKVEFINVGSDSSSDSDVHQLLVPEIEIISSD